LVVPCHRDRQERALTGYQCGITRKQAMIGSESGEPGMP
jgi:O6-methylguanine-DNA--protein-cysteine methyltransferase